MTHANHEIFIASIHSKNHLTICFDSIEKGTITRTCIPFDYAVSKRYKDGAYRYHFYDLDSPEGSHTLSILPQQIITIDLMPAKFEPADYIRWIPKWNIARNWGVYS
ncbi:hypothetical protein KHS38_03755 [Mucilaginibacter sp. Bleaf8]|uniref:hypothetical protein n=1 Tax=Mucilaginibacter sp. Bleaf8 TaxID=2834430 RepID=UPI001BCD89DF|nr:hypothetical protein [Mucilaginibacter sp. Bleaf8]MBS7563511.1 hypothetical protein [Mucilaginibacter sp. Bleaf8]